MALLLRMAAVLAAVQMILAVDGESDESCTRRPFFDFETNCTLSTTPAENQRTDKGPYVACRHDKQHFSNNKRVCMEWFDHKCAVRLSKTWCCEEYGGKKWKFVDEEFQHKMTIMEGDKCGCHYKIGGELDENGNETYTANKRAGMEGAMIAFRCRDINRQIDSIKFEKIAYLRPINSNPDHATVRMVATLNVNKSLQR